MIGTLRGRLLLKRPECIVIETGGVGYEVSVPLSVLSELPDEGAEVFLFIHTNVKDDAIDLYGFLDENGRRAFRSLLGISGVGPRLALNILSGSTVEDFLRAVETEDVGLLTRIPGVGKKTAQRIILELRERLPAAGGKREAAYEDTLSALINLGYKKALAQEAVERAYRRGIREIENLLKESLKYLNR
ncbi:MAG TPA: Holliday junction branch migration protein RuvA [Nitrospirae bacterium]|nr:Holliday junction branch migration protein RuvA [Nitrospirota bacterium]